MKLHWTGIKTGISKLASQEQCRTHMHLALNTCELSSSMSGSQKARILTSLMEMENRASRFAFKHCLGLKRSYARGSFTAVRDFPAQAVLQSLWLNHELRKFSFRIHRPGWNWAKLFFFVLSKFFYITRFLFSLNFPTLSPFFFFCSLPFNFFIFSSFNHCVLFLSSFHLWVYSFLSFSYTLCMFLLSIPYIWKV